MNVLHIGNTAAIPKDLRDHLRAHGIGSDIVTFYPDGWTDCERSETLSCRNRYTQSYGGSL
jgi:hypothetical protein